MGEIAAREMEELEGVVEARRVARAFAHDREELRTLHAHARLGFSDEQMLALLSEAGFAAAAPVALPGKPLTVKIWIATRTHQAARAPIAIPAKDQSR